MSRVSARRTEENRIRRQGFQQVAGVDEVGRGCLAGPVVAAAVVLDPKSPIWKLQDSKLLNSRARSNLYEKILTKASAFSVFCIDAREIDRINIHNASLKAMRNAVLGIEPKPDFALVDGFPLPNLNISQRAIVQGDRLCSAIAAASIVAKVTRDRMMLEFHEIDSRYGFDQNKGYPTKAHLAAVKLYGYSKLHRQSFRPRSLLSF